MAAGGALFVFAAGNLAVQKRSDPVMGGFEHLWVLVLALPVMAGVFYWTRRYILAAMFTFIVLAAAGPYLVQKDTARPTVILVDRSESMHNVPLDEIVGNLHQTHANASMMSFAQTAFESDLQISAALGQTNLEAAVFSAMQEIRSNGHIVLISDMLQTQGQVERAIRELTARNISLEIIVPDYSLAREVILREVTIPDDLTRHQTAYFDIQIESASDCTAELEITNSLTNETRVIPVELDKGLTRLQVPVETAADRVETVIGISSANDTFAENNLRAISAPIHPKPAVCVVGSRADYEAVKGRLGHYAELIFAESVLDPECDLLIVADCSREAMSPQAAELIRQRVSEGMGLLVLPGANLLRDNLFDVDYFADLLPVRVHRQNTKSSPDGCMVFIVDTSGSMQGARLILARGIVRSSIERMSSYDKVGIVEFYGTRKWAAPIQSAANQIDLNRAINRLTAGGGTVILPAIEEAFYGLLNVNAAAKHIVVITDGGVESGDYESLLRRIRQNNINVSFVLAGPSAHTGFLAELSVYGGGKFLHAPDRFSLPEIDIKTLSSKNGSLFQDSRGRPETADASEIFNGVDLSGLPENFLYIPAARKLSASTLLNAGENPVLAAWHIGLGTAAVCTSDLFSQTGTEKLFQNLCRSLYRKPTSPPRQEPAHFEIKSCRPDVELAEKIGRIVSSEPVHKIRTVDLHSYCYLLSLACFLMQIVLRRLPRTAAAGAIVLLGAGLTYAGYPETMNRGIHLYTQSDPNCQAVFLQACGQSENPDDRRYALAWALMASHRLGQYDILERHLLDSLDAQSAALLNILYALNNDFESARRLRGQADLNPVFTAKDKQHLDRQLNDIAMVSRDYDAAEDYYRQQNDLVSLMKIEMLRGNRARALEAAASVESIELPSDMLLDLCRTLRQLGFRQEALERAAALHARQDTYYFEAVVFLFELHRAMQQKEQAVQLVLNAKDSGRLTDKQVYETAILLEEAGRMDLAIQTHNDVYQRTRAVDCLMRIADLHGQKGDNLQSFQIWRDLWRQSDEPFMLYQVTGRLLEAAGKADQLVDLVMELEGRLSDGRATDKEVDLLIDLYASIRDPFAPIEIARQYYGDQSAASLKKQYHIYRRCGLYRKCAAVLSRLIELEPQQKADYLQQMAIAAIERGHEQDAMAAAEHLKRASADIGQEFSAGLLALLGRPEEAMEAYHQLIAADPNRYELWLLWAEQAAQCRPPVKDMAIDRLTSMIHRDMADDFYLVIADCLLNLQAPRKTLLDLYQMTLRRIERNPDRIYLYQLAIDILSETDPAASPADLLLQAASYDRQRRLAFVREAMDSLGKLSGRRLDLARLLVFMGWKCSPSQHIQLGQMFLENGDDRLAEYLFRCNSLLNADNQGLYLAIADIYQRRSDFQSALNILLEALTLYPEDVTVLIETANCYEILGQYSQAYPLYRRAYRLSPAEIEIAQPLNPEDNKLHHHAYLLKRSAFEGIVVTAETQLPADIQPIYDALMAANPLPAEKTSARTPASAASPARKETPAIRTETADVELEEIIHGNVPDAESFNRINEIVRGINQQQARYLSEEFGDYALVMGRTVLLDYLNAVLSQAKGASSEALQLITRCYLDNPQNRHVEFKIKEFYEAGRKYRELADLFVQVAEKIEKPPFYWREITRLYYLAGDMEKAKWANSYACGQGHYILGLIDYLFLYTKDRDIEKMRQYFRKYQIDCRRQNKYFALRWNYWDHLEEDGQVAERQTVYMVLSHYRPLSAEFERYRRAVYPDRRDSIEYEKAYLNINQINQQQRKENE
jgi:tetratricopeptide (TPR) repeat protein